MVVNGLGTVLPCCDPSKVSDWAAIWSDTCQICWQSTYDAQQQTLADQGLPSGSIPTCDSNAGFFSNLFSNDCNVSVTKELNAGLDLPNIPSWAWAVGLGIVGLVILKLK